ncbi:MAG: hypothetical protein WBG42_15355, partial [Cryomorphaceae bacterium]
MQKFLFAFFLLTTFGLTSCSDKNRVFEENVEIPNEKWTVSEKAILEAEINDTLSSHNFLINVRNT